MAKWFRSGDGVFGLSGGRTSPPRVFLILEGLGVAFADSEATTSGRVY